MRAAKNWRGIPRIRLEPPGGDFQIPHRIDIFMRQRAPMSKPASPPAGDELEMTLLPSQLSKYTLADFEGKTAEQRIAWRLLLRNMMDGLATSPSERRKAIHEIRLWMDAPPGEFEYEFDYWCDQLDVDAGYMRRGLRRWLEAREQEMQ